MRIKTQAISEFTPVRRYATLLVAISTFPSVLVCLVTTASASDLPLDSFATLGYGHQPVGTSDR